MSNADQQHISDGWRIWLAEQIGMIRGSLMSLERRMDRMEERFMNGRSRRHWMTYLKYIPWQFLVLFALTVLIITGHITLSDIKPAIIRKLQEF
jgi:hypothetical protein